MLTCSVARSTLVKGSNLVQKKAKLKGPKKGQLFFPILTAIAKSHEPILSNLLGGNVPQSQL